MATTVIPCHTARRRQARLARRLAARLRALLAAAMSLAALLGLGQGASA